MDENERLELAEAISDNRERIAEDLEKYYVMEYPRSKANEIPRSEIRSWTDFCIGELIHVLETNDAAYYRYDQNHGDMLVDPYEPELSKYISRLGSIMFMFRHIAPILFDLRPPDRMKSQRLLDSLEELGQKLIAYNQSLFSEYIAQKGSLARSWRAFEIRRRPAEPDTPSTGEIEQSDLFSPLTAREEEVLDLVVNGKTNAEIAQLLHMSQNTVKNHISRIFDKYGTRNRAELVAKVMRAGIN